MVNGVNGLSAPSHVELAHKPALVSVLTMTNLAKALNLNLVTLKIATNLQLMNPHRTHPLQLMIINLLKRPIKCLIKSHPNRITKFLKLHPMRISVALIKVAKITVALIKAVKVSAITATGVNGASATAVLVPKPALVKFWDHPTINVPKLRSHSHAILVARTADKQPLQIYLS
jgi:hypothetical protein